MRAAVEVTDAVTLEDTEFEEVEEGVTEGVGVTEKVGVTEGVTDGMGLHMFPAAVWYPAPRSLQLPHSCSLGQSALQSRGQ